MKKIISFIMLFILTAGALSAQDKQQQLSRCISDMSAIQSYLEFYYMGTGDYPKSLEDLNSILNEDLVPGSVKIAIPSDPATGKSFVYKVAATQKTYTLSAPEPAQYGMEKLELSQIPWGWMDEVAKAKSLRTRGQICRGYLELLTVSVKNYQAKEKKLPPSLDVLAPDYIKALPDCPQCGKPYRMENKGDDFIIYCAEPASHKCSVFQSSLRSGFKSKLLEEKKQ